MGERVRWRRILVGVAVVSTMFAAGAMAQSASEWAGRAATEYVTGDYAASAESYGHSIEAGATNPTIYFNAACSHALAGEPDAAFERLEQAIDQGWRDAAHLRADSDLTSLHADPRWKVVVADCERAEAEFLASLGDPELRTELFEMRRIDQAARTGQDIPELADMSDVDAVHTARMKEIVEELGWPGASLVGEDGASAAWLLVQHADADPEFQRRCLELMRAMPDGEVSPGDVAYLTDRVRVNEGKKQLYGTQFWTVDGELVPRPIEDEAGLDARRLNAGLGTMAEYTARITAR